MSLEALIKKHRPAIDAMTDGSDITDTVYDDFYDYYLNAGAIPYGTAKARDGDPYWWVAARILEDAKKETLF
jgi:hypothetical protein